MRTLVLRVAVILLFTYPASFQSIAQQPPTVATASDIYKQASPAVVLIQMLNDKGEIRSSGSGFLIDATGKIVTNYHVIAHAKQGTVRLANKDAYDAIEVLDIDKRKDIAIIKIKAIELPFLSLGKSSTVDIGDKVYSLSNPLGVFQNTLSDGIVSGIRLGDGYRYFQISAPISHGSSGSPIFNTKGEVIGIATATMEEGQNLNFAVPIDYVKGMLTSYQPKSLASIYEPEPPKEETAKGALEKTSEAGETQKLMSEKGSFMFLEKKLHVWTVEDSSKYLGSPLRKRTSTGQKPAEIYAYPDPTSQFREFELAFEIGTPQLNGVFAYPWNLTWDECKATWGSDVRTIKYDDGTRFYAYKKRRLNVLVNKNGSVISIGVY
jgi:hypothetical protein